MTGLKAISIDQPYASLIMAGVKRWETRGCPPNGDMRPDGVRGLPGLKVDAGERVAVAATQRWAKGWCRWYDPDSSTTDSVMMDVLGSVGVDFTEDINGSCQWNVSARWAGLPLGALLGTVEVPGVVPIIDAERGWQYEADAPEAAILVDGDTLTLIDGRTEVDISDQLPFGHWVPGGWAWELADPIPTTEQCPACKGRPKQPSTRIEGASRSCQHCNSTRTFNFLDRPGTICRCEGARREACPVCLGDGSCDPIPVKGKQGIWRWTP